MCAAIVVHRYIRYACFAIGSVLNLLSTRALLDAVVSCGIIYTLLSYICYFYYNNTNIMSLFYVSAIRGRYAVYVFIFTINIHLPVF